MGGYPSPPVTTHERSDEAAWEAQRAAQLGLSIEERIAQNDALARLRLEAMASVAVRPFG